MDQQNPLLPIPLGVTFLSPTYFPFLYHQMRSHSFARMLEAMSIVILSGYSEYTMGWTEPKTLDLAHTAYCAVDSFSGGKAAGAPS